MFYHTKCGNKIYIDASSAIKFLVDFGIGKTVLRMSSGDISIIENVSSIETVFYCPTCREKVEESDIYILCQQCGEKISLSTAYKSSTSGGLYCKKHIEILFPNDGVVLLSKISKKLSVRN